MRTGRSNALSARQDLAIWLSASALEEVMRRSVPGLYRRMKAAERRRLGMPIWKQVLRRVLLVMAVVLFFEWGKRQAEAEGAACRLER
jgi:hypothetical protein